MTKPNKRSKVGRVPRPISTSGSVVRRFVRSSFQSQFVTTASANPLQSGVAFVLSALPNYTEFTTLFDQYRITKITYKFLSPYVATEMVASGVATPDKMLNLYSVNDFDDATALSNAAMGEYETFQARPLTQGRDISITYRPRIAVGAYQGTFVGFANMDAQWIDSASPSVQHYGLKFNIEEMCGDGAPAFFTTKYAFVIIATAEVECRTVR